MKRLAKHAHRKLGRLSDEKRAERESIVRQVEEELGDRIGRPSPARVALAKFKLARLREGLSLGDVSRKSGMNRGNLCRLESNVENVQRNTLARLADAIGYEVMVEFKRRKGRSTPRLPGRLTRLGQ